MFHVHVTFTDGDSDEFVQGDPVTIGTWLANTPNIQTLTVSPIR